MQCPECGSCELDVEVVLHGTVRCRFEDGGSEILGGGDELHSDFPRMGHTACAACEWSGAVAQAQPASDADQPLPVRSLLDLLYCLPKSGCSVAVQKEVTAAINELIQYRRDAEPVGRSTRSVLSSNNSV